MTSKPKWKRTVNTFLHLFLFYPASNPASKPGQFFAIVRRIRARILLTACGRHSLHFECLVWSVCSFQIESYRDPTFLLLYIFSEGASKDFCTVWLGQCW
ncbi:hypothetical protein B0T09DRAFT_345483 [Sordaria sp. MPI-SDFR-AT-0083]|nr:hypothetical protein B0T09DRAFT_345483 [Sordaria sp. MPI-SDFR-AT-0083]